MTNQKQDKSWSTRKLRRLETPRGENNKQRKLWLLESWNSFNPQTSHPHTFRKRHFFISLPDYSNQIVQPSVCVWVIKRLGSSLTKKWKKKKRSTWFDRVSNLSKCQFYDDAQEKSEPLSPHSKTPTGPAGTGALPDTSPLTRLIPSVTVCLASQETDCNVWSGPLTFMLMVVWWGQKQKELVRRTCETLHLQYDHGWCVTFCDVIL